MRPPALLASVLHLGLIVAAALQTAPLPAQAPAKAKAIGPKPDDPRGKAAKPAAAPAPVKR
ncbi:MAG TPA: hypothetical protein VJ528_06615 [Geothrix sp.]|nr:hypothetical protein [Geothrix sp.]